MTLLRIVIPLYIYWWSMIFSENRRPLFGIMLYWWSMIFSDLASPAEALSRNDESSQGFAQAGNRCPLFGIML
jgi:hypothetical protein